MMKHLSPSALMPLLGSFLAPIHAISVENGDTVTIIVLAGIFLLGALLFFYAAWRANKNIDRDKRKW